MAFALTPAISLNEFYSYTPWGEEAASDIQCQASVSSFPHYVYELEGGKLDDDTVLTVLSNQEGIGCEFEYSSPHGDGSVRRLFVRLLHLRWKPARLEGSGEAPKVGVAVSTSETLL